MCVQFKDFEICFSFSDRVVCLMQELTNESGVELPQMTLTANEYCRIREHVFTCKYAASRYGRVHIHIYIYL